MKRASAVVLLVVVVVGGLSAASSAAVHKRLTRTHAVSVLHGMLGAQPTQVQLVWADEALTRVVLEWTAYSPHAKVHVVGGKLGGPSEDGMIRGPARAWLGANGGPPMGIGTVRPKHPFGPYREYISASLVRALQRAGVRIRLAPLRPKPAVAESLALRSLTSSLGYARAKLHRLWLVHVKHHGHSVLAWMAVGRAPHHKCPPLVHGCRALWAGPVVGLLNATSGRGMMVTGFRR